MRRCRGVIATKLLKRIATIPAVAKHMQNLAEPPSMRSLRPGFWQRVNEERPSWSCLLILRDARLYSVIDICSWATMKECLRAPSWDIEEERGVFQIFPKSLTIG